MTVADVPVLQLVPRTAGMQALFDVNPPSLELLFSPRV
jgi:hypothetical protein